MTEALYRNDGMTPAKHEGGGARQKRVSVWREATNGIPG